MIRVFHIIQRSVHFAASFKKFDFPGFFNFSKPTCCWTNEVTQLDRAWLVPNPAFKNESNGWYRYVAFGGNYFVLIFSEPAVALLFRRGHCSCRQWEDVNLRARVNSTGLAEPFNKDMSIPAATRCCLIWCAWHVVRNARNWNVFSLVDLAPQNIPISQVWNTLTWLFNRKYLYNMICIWCFYCGLVGKDLLRNVQAPPRRLLGSFSHFSCFYPRFDTHKHMHLSLIFGP